jgi:hypothetical protein
MKSVLKNSINVKVTLVLGIFFIALTAALPPLAKRSDFSGKWIFNINKSEMGNIPERAAVKQFDVNQTKDSVYITRITVSASDKEIASSEVISLNGDYCSSVLSDGKIKTSMITWSPDEREMTTVSNYSAPGNTSNVLYTLSQIWKLDDTENELVVILTSPSYTIKCVYDRR